MIKTMQRALVIILTGQLMLSACKRATEQTEGPVEGPLAQLATPPRSLPAACGLRWQSKPMPLAAEPASERDYFVMLLRFWIGEKAALDPSQLDVGLSNAYSSDQSDSAVVVFSARFKNTSAAESAVEAVKAQRNGDSKYWWHREGRLAVFESHEASVPDECIQTIRKEVMRKAKESA